MSINASKYAKSTTKIARAENNDCTVRAWMTIFNCTYNQAHSFMKSEFKRPDRDGVSGFAIKLTRWIKDSGSFRFQKLRELDEFDIARVKEVKFTDSLGYERTTLKHRRYSLRRFCRTYPKGRYLILVRGHALAIIDGVIHDWPGESDLRRVVAAYQIIEDK